MPERRPFERYTIRPREQLDTHPAFFSLCSGAPLIREFNSAIDPFDDGLRSTSQVFFICPVVLVSINVLDRPRCRHFTNNTKLQTLLVVLPTLLRGHFERVPLRKRGNWHQAIIHARGIPSAANKRNFRCASIADGSVAFPADSFDSQYNISASATVSVRAHQNRAEGEDESDELCP